MSIKSPIFTMPQPQHFSDYGFDPQIDYFQVLEEARRHKREARSIDSIHFKLQKPISKEECKKSKKRRWWRNALLFWKWKWVEEEMPTGYFRKPRGSISGPVYGGEIESRTRSRAISGPVYGGDIESGTRSRPSSGTATPTRKGDVDIPYFCLRELNLDHPQHRMSTSALPIYLVT